MVPSDSLDFAEFIRSPSIFLLFLKVALGSLGILGSFLVPLGSLGFSFGFLRFH